MGVPRPVNDYHDSLLLVAEESESRNVVLVRDHLQGYLLPVDLVHVQRADGWDTDHAASWHCDRPRVLLPGGCLPTHFGDQNLENSAILVQLDSGGVQSEYCARPPAEDGTAASPPRNVWRGCSSPLIRIIACASSALMLIDGAQEREMESAQVMTR